MAVADALSGGFENPVFGSQAVFRALLEAMSRPAHIVALPALAAPPVPLTAGTADLILALADADTPIYLDAPLATCEAVVRFIRFHTGAPIVADPARATFAVIADAAAMPAINRFPAGTADYPDRSATLILQVGTLTDGPPLTFTGPGIETTQTIAAAPLPAGFAAAWDANRARYPLGVDMVFATADAVAALPRSARLQKSGGA